MDEELEQTILHDEHLLLGAKMGEGAFGRFVPLTYPSAGTGEHLLEGAALFDLAGHGSLLFSGASAPSFVDAAFAGKVLEIGQVSLEAVLTGDGALVSVALLARTGDAEYACWDVSGRGDALHAWLSFLSMVEQGGTRAFPDLTIEDASEALVPLLLWGDAATAVISDYLGDQALPDAGTVRNLNLDALGCLVATPRLNASPSFLVLVPPPYARVLWRSFLSFPVVVPCGRDELLELVSDALPSFEGALQEQGRVTTSQDVLESAGLIRKEPTFVGARGLS